MKEMDSSFFIPDDKDIKREKGEKGLNIFTLQKEILFLIGEDIH